MIIILKNNTQISVFDPRMIKHPRPTMLPRLMSHELMITVKQLMIPLKLLNLRVIILL